MVSECHCFCHHHLNANSPGLICVCPCIYLSHNPFSPIKDDQREVMSSFEFESKDFPGKFTIRDMSDQFKQLYFSIIEFVEDNKERALAISKLQESVSILDHAISRTRL